MVPAAAIADPVVANLTTNIQTSTDESSRLQGHVFFNPDFGYKSYPTARAEGRASER